MSLLFEVLLLYGSADGLDVGNHCGKTTILVKVNSYIRIVNFFAVYMPTIGIIAASTIGKCLIHTIFTHVHGCIKFLVREIQIEGIDKIRNLLIGNFTMKATLDVSLNLFNKIIPIRDSLMKSVTESNNAFIRLVRKRRVDKHELFRNRSIYFHSFFQPNDVSSLKESRINHKITSKFFTA